MKNKFDSIIYSFFRVLAIIVVLFLLLSNTFFYTILEYTEINNIVIKNPLEHIIVIVMILAILASFTVIINIFGKKKKCIKRFIVTMLFLLYTLISLKSIMYFKTFPFADFLEIHTISSNWINDGISSIYNYLYLQTYPHQVSMVLGFKLIYSIFNNTNYLTIEYVNVFFNIISIIGLYNIAKLINKELLFNGFTFLVSITFIPLILLSVLIYGDYISLAFLIWSFYFIYKYCNYKDKVLYVVISGILLDIAIMFKNNSYIALIACILYLILYLFNCKKIKELIKKILIIIMFTIISFVPYKLITNYYINKLHIDTTTSVPTNVWLYIGMSESYRGSGWYSEVVNDYFNQREGAKERYNVYIKERIDYLIDNPIYTIKFYLFKCINGYTNPYFQGDHYVLNDNELRLENMHNNCLYKFGLYYMNAMIILIYAGAFYDLLFNFKKEKLIFYIFLLGGFSFHILWEMKSRYVLTYFVLLIPIGCSGLTDFYYKIKKALK